MRLLKSLALSLALGLVAAPAFAAPPANAPAKAAPNAKAKSKTRANKAEKRAARLVEAMKKEGIAEAKAQKVVSVIKSYKPELATARKEMKSARTALRDDDAANDKAARDRIAATKKKLETIKQRRKADIAKILTAAERAKLEKVLDKKGKRGKGQRKAKRRNRAA